VLGPRRGAAATPSPRATLLVAGAHGDGGDLGYTLAPSLSALFISLFLPSLVSVRPFVMLCTRDFRGNDRMGGTRGIERARRPQYGCQVRSS